MINLLESIHFVFSMFKWELYITYHLISLNLLDLFTSGSNFMYTLHSFYNYPTINLISF